MGFLEEFFGNNQKTAAEYALDGETFLLKNKYRQALRALDKAIELEPENDMFYFSRSKVKKEMQDYENAVKDIDCALKLQPQITLYKELKDILTPLVK